MIRNTTNMNGELTKQLTQKWGGLLGSNAFRPIKSKDAKFATAMLLENESRWLEENTNTSILGGNAGLTGGALAASDSYATGDNRVAKMIIPMIRRVYPELSSNEMVGVQAMPGPVCLGFALRYKYLPQANIKGDGSTEHVHDELGGDPRGVKGVETQFSATKKWTETPTTVIDLKIELTLIKGLDYPDVKLTYPVINKVRGQVALSIYGIPQLTVFGGDESDAISKFATLFATDATLSGKYVGTRDFKGDGYQYDNVGNSEMGYQRLDTRFTGRADERMSQSFAGGRMKFRPEDTGVAAIMQQFENSGAVATTSFGFEKKAVEAGTRRIGTSWSLEIEQDLKNTNGIDIESEATQQMSYELQAEIDREMTVRMLYSALYNDQWSLWDGTLADARWMGERNRAFYQYIVKESMRMQVRNRRGAANFIVCTPDVCALLQTLDDFALMPENSSINTSNMATAKVGTVGNGRFTVFNDTRSAVYGDDYGTGYDDLYAPSVNHKMPNYCMLGYKGTEVFDAGIIYCPYIPIMMQKVVDPMNFSPKVGLLTRYGVLDNLFGAHLYYHVIIIESLSQPGLSSDYKGIYPPGYIPSNYTGGTTYGFPTQTVANTVI